MFFEQLNLQGCIAKSEGIFGDTVNSAYYIIWITFKMMTIVRIQFDKKRVSDVLQLIANIQHVKFLHVDEYFCT